MIYREKFNVNQFWELMVKEIFSFVQKYDQKAPKSTPEESLENLKEKKKRQLHMLCLRNGNKLHP